MILKLKAGPIDWDKQGIFVDHISNKDISLLADYNRIIDAYYAGAVSLEEMGNAVNKTMDAMSDASKNLVVTAGYGEIALDTLGKKFSWVALKAQALNAAVSMGIGLLVSLAASTLITLIDNYIRRVEIAHEATAQKIAEYEKQKSSIASLNDSFDGNYGMYN